MMLLISFSGFEFAGSRTIEIQRTTTKLIFVKADSHFKYEIPFFVKVKYIWIQRCLGCIVVPQPRPFCSVFDLYDITARQTGI